MNSDEVFLLQPKQEHPSLSAKMRKFESMTRFEKEDVPDRLPITEMLEALHNPYSDSGAPTKTIWRG